MLESRNPIYELSRELIEMRIALDGLQENQQISIRMDKTKLTYDVIRNDLSELCLNRKRFIIDTVGDYFEVTRLADGISISEFYQRTSTYKPDDCQKKLIVFFDKYLKNPLPKHAAGISDYMKTQNVITISHILRNMVTSACFKNSSHGANMQIRYTLGELVNLGYIRTPKSCYGSRAQLFQILKTE